MGLKNRNQRRFYKRKLKNAAPEPWNPDQNLFKNEIAHTHQVPYNDVHFANGFNRRKDDMPRVFRRNLCTWARESRRSPPPPLAAHYLTRKPVKRSTYGLLAWIQPDSTFELQIKWCDQSCYTVIPMEDLSKPVLDPDTLVQRHDITPKCHGSGTLFLTDPDPQIRGPDLWIPIRKAN